ncbi:MAG: late competence development ComFB family protein [Clostridia bacterium]|nr:late competence development ComFB family protein [Clostridia bacterium]
MEVTNFMERVVERKLIEMLDQFPELCRCEECMADIKALALNHLTPHYVATEKGELYTKLDSVKVQSEVDVTRAIIEAIKIVEQKPHHHAEKK